MARDEFNNYSNNEFNNTGSEFKYINPDPYANIKVKEAKDSPVENLKVPENFNENNNPLVLNESIDKKDLAKEQKDRLDKANQTRNSSDTGMETNANTGLESGSVDVNAAVEAEASTTAAATSEASVVSLTGGVTILSACVVAAATVGGAMLNEPPIIDKNEIRYESGTNYISYEFNISRMTEGQDYYVLVYYDKDIIMQIPIEEEGPQKQLITGLLPDRRYDFKIVAGSGLGAIPYYEGPCYTMNYPLPKPVFEFEPRIDFENGIFDLEYNIFISDYYGVGSNTYLELYSGETLIMEDHNLDDESFFRGALTQLSDGTEINAKVYSTYTEKEVLHENELIGTYGYVTKYPDDFVPIDDKFLSTYTFDESSFESSFNKNSGVNVLNINTGFENKVDSREKYRIDIYSKDNVLIDSKISNEANVEFEIPAYYETITARLTPIKTENNTNNSDVKQKLLADKEFEYKEITYNFDPIIKDISINYYMEGYSISALAEETIFNQEDSLIAKVIQYNTDGNEYEQQPMQFRGIELHNEYMIQGSADTVISTDIIDKVKLEIYYNDKLISVSELNNIKTNADLNIYEIDSDGNVILTYNIDNPEELELKNASLSVDGSSNYFEKLESNTGKVTVDVLNSNLIRGYFYVDYLNRDGRKISTSFETEEINLNAEVVVSNYVTYVSSEYKIYLKFDTFVDGQKVNMDLGVSVYEKYIEGYEEITGYNYKQSAEGIYIENKCVYDFDYATDSGTEQYYIKYKIESEGFDNTEKELYIPKTMDNQWDYLVDGTKPDLMKYSTEVYGNENNQKIYYVKTSNTDGTVNYYFYSEFNEELDDASDTKYHTQRLHWYYTDENNKVHHEYSDCFKDTYYALENVLDKDYGFQYLVLYTQGDGLSYCKTDAGAKLYEASESVSSDAIIMDKEAQSTQIEFSVDTDSIASNVNTILLDIEGTTYNLPITELSSEGRLGENEELLYYTSKEEGSSLISYSITINKLLDLSSGYPKITYNYIPKLVNKIGSNKVINSNSLNEEFTYNVFEYKSEYDLSDFVEIQKDQTYTSEYFTYNKNDYNNVNEFNINVPQRSSFDSRDTYRIEVYSNNELIAENMSYYGNSVTLSVDPIYTDLEFRIVYCKKANDDIYTDIKSEKLLDYHVDNEFTVSNESANFDYIDMTNRLNYSATVPALSDPSYTSYYVKVIEYYNDGTNNETLLDTKFETDISVEQELGENVTKVDVVICTGYTSGYGDKHVMYVRTLEFPQFEFDDYSYDDATDSISLPFSINIGEGNTLKTGTLYCYDDTYDLADESARTIIINSLDSNELRFEVENITYETTDGLTVTYSRGEISTTLSMELMYDYKIVSYKPSEARAKYDESTKTVYYYDYDSESYLSKDGVEAPDGTVQVILIESYYVTEGSIKGNCKGCIIPYGSSQYQMNVTTSGNPTRSINGMESLDEDYYSAGPEISKTGDELPATISLTFLHDLTDYYYDSANGMLYPIRNLTLEYSITDDSNGETYNYSITYSEPSHDTIPTIADSFNATSSVTKNTINPENVDITINTGFDSSEHENYYYKLYLYDKTEFSSYSPTLIYASDYLNSDEVIIENISNKPYDARVEIYYYSNGNYSKYVNSKSILVINSAIINTEYNDQTLTRTITFDSNMLNSENMTLAFTNNNSISHEIDLESADAQTITNGTVTIQKDGDNIIVTLEGSTYDDVSGTFTVNQGNTEIGYVDITYSI